MLHQFITTNRSEILKRCRAKVAARPAPRATAEEITHGIPLFLDQLVEILRLRTGSSSEIRSSATLHGDELLRLGYTAGQVVHDYGDVCQSITELSSEMGALISTEEFHTFNRCLDDAIADAVTEFGKKRDVQISADGNERLGAFAHELRNLLNSATLSFEILQRGTVGVNGSTGAVLGRSLSSLAIFAERTMAEARLDAGIENRECISIPDFLEEVEAATAMEARARGLRLNVVREDDSVTVEADRQILTSAIVNLLQNAMKFTRPRGSVTLRLSFDAKRVRMEIEDECGGLPPGDPSDLFLPFEQRSSDRSGMGLGLGISRRGAEASGGHISVRNLPGAGCIFTIDLPRGTVPVEDCHAEVYS